MSGRARGRTRALSQAVQLVARIPARPHGKECSERYTTCLNIWDAGTDDRWSRFLVQETCGNDYRAFSTLPLRYRGCKAQQELKRWDLLLGHCRRRNCTELLALDQHRRYVGSLGDKDGTHNLTPYAYNKENTKQSQ